MLFLHSNFALTIPNMPPEAWWLAALVLLVLGLAALVDTVTSSIPDPLIFLGLVAVTGTQGIYMSWPFAATNLAYALIAAFIVWAINQLWYRFKKVDAIGMGDAKWTMLAVACFGPGPALFAWGFGACLAVLWMGATRIVRFQIARVYFAPFLFMGLAAGLYWLRIKGMPFGILG
jgi:prepilin signal peptidase PulO-like enzyme (type II secretory pathway)